MSIMLALLLQAAVPPAEVELGEGEVRQLLLVSKGRQSVAIEQARTLRGAALEEALRRTLSNRTAVIFSEGRGLFVEYSAPDGSLRMWAPGERSAVSGYWGVQRFGRKLVNACFRFRAAAPPPSGGFSANECLPADRTLAEANVVREWHGDVFGLMRGIPYVKSTMGMPTP